MKNFHRLISHPDMFAHARKIISVILVLSVRLDSMESTVYHAHETQLTLLYVVKEVYVMMVWQGLVSVSVLILRMTLKFSVKVRLMRPKSTVTKRRRKRLLDL